MANKNATEISLMKGLTVKLDNDTVFTLGYFVHTEEKARDKSEYLYLGRVDKLADLEAESTEMLSDANKLKNWTWKGLPKYDAVVYDKDSTNSRGGRWIKSKIRKAVEWDQFLKIVDGWNEKKQAYNDNAKYASEDYVTEDGQKIADIRAAKDELLKLVGKTVSHNCFLKSRMSA
jgi:hypothetical protein